MIQAIFLDRDGTIGGDHTVHYPGSFQLFHFTKDIISTLKEKKIKILSFTNQPGIAEGQATEMDFEEELNNFGFDDVFICPHKASDGCECRKPNIGMLLRAAEKHKLNLQECVVIGDRWSDIVAGQK